MISGGATVKATVGERGQVTIPKALREKLGIRPGSRLDFTERGGALLARKVPEGDAVARVSGILGRGPGTDRFLDEIRGEVD
jgi:AbrB family looped-hinge helix DNA binding protein